MPTTPKKGSEPAFPTFGNAGDGMYAEADGMTLREWFAGQALNGYLASYTQGDVSADQAAKCAVELADALLAELEK